ncbi:MAG: sensor histidine kinase [Phycisphaerales bacterium]
MRYFPVINPSIAFGVGLLAGIGFAVLGSKYVVKRSLARVRAAERRAQSAERLAEIGAMTGGLAHEIKNPLSTIGLNAQLLSEGIEELGGVEAETKGRLVRRLGSLRREVERLKGILTDFLSYAGELRLDLKPTDLGAALEELADFFGPQAAQQNIRLRVESLPIGSVALDVGHFKQAILNLLLNAAQAMASQPPEKPRELIIKLSASTEADKLRVATIDVIDTGPGIPPEIREKIFSPYFTTKSGGTGLGLPTTRRIIEAHGGRLELFSEIGQGSDFRIVIPMQ